MKLQSAKQAGGKSYGVIGTGINEKQQKKKYSADYAYNINAPVFSILRSAFHIVVLFLSAQFIFHRPVF